MEHRNCIQCSSLFKAYPSESKKHCSLACSKKTWRDKMAKLPNAQIGHTHHKWAGDEASYNALHRWVQRKKGKPNKCSNCEIEGIQNGRNWSIDWANKDGLYNRDLNDWIGLCRKCHNIFDKKTQKRAYWNGAEMVFKGGTMS